MWGLKRELVGFLRVEKGVGGVCGGLRRELEGLWGLRRGLEGLWGLGGFVGVEKRVGRLLKESWVVKESCFVGKVRSDWMRMT